MRVRIHAIRPIEFICNFDTELTYPALALDGYTPCKISRLNPAYSDIGLQRDEIQIIESVK